MPQSINSNIIALNAQRNLRHAQCALASSMQRLSSGLIVNSAKDDAAGMAIAETANLSRAQILQQAGNAMIAQANPLPQQVLQLLR